MEQQTLTGDRARSRSQVDVGQELPQGRPRKNQALTFQQARDRLVGATAVVLGTAPTVVGSAYVALADAGVDVRVARHVPGLSELLRARHPDLLLLDARFEALDVQAFVRDLVARGALGESLVYAFTRETSRSERRRLMSAGCCEVFHDPIDARLFAMQLAATLPGGWRPKSGDASRRTGGIVAALTGQWLPRSR